VQVEGTIEKVESGYAFTEIVVRPNLSVNTEEDGVRGARLLQKVKTLCLVSRALSVPQTFEPHLHVNKTPALV
jgi:organic hydroperoxide reductase OsmC/OhrA